MLQWRKIIAVTAVAVIAFAACYAPRFAHASHHLGSSAQHVEADGHGLDHNDDHGHDSAAVALCHTHGDTQGQGNDTDALKYCCAKACSASALIWNPAELRDEPVGVRISTVLIEFLRSTAWAAIDPPPRTV